MILLVAVVAAAVTVVALPEQVTGSIQAAVCRVVGQECGGDDGSAAPSPSPTPSPSEQTDQPAPGESGDPGDTGDPGELPGDPDYQRALDDFNKANQDFNSVEDEWNGFNLLEELVKLGLDFLFGDIKACLENPNIVDCLWALVNLIPWTKLFKFLGAIPKLIKLADRFLDMKRRLDKARKLRDDALRNLRDIARKKGCPVPAGASGTGSRIPIPMPSGAVAVVVPASGATPTVRLPVAWAGLLAQPRGPKDPINLGNGYTARVDKFNVGGQASFEIHVYYKGKEVGVRGPNGWIMKHGHKEPPTLPEDVENKLNGRVNKLRTSIGLPAC